MSYFLFQRWILCSSSILTIITLSLRWSQFKRDKKIVFSLNCNATKSHTNNCNRFIGNTFCGFRELNANSDHSLVKNVKIGSIWESKLLFNKIYITTTFESINRRKWKQRRTKRDKKKVKCKKFNSKWVTFMFLGTSSMYFVRRVNTSLQKYVRLKRKGLCFSTERSEIH